MKVISYEEKIIVITKKNYLDEFKNETFIEDYVISIINKLIKRYNIELNYFLEVNIYQSQYCGLVIELINQESDYYHYYSNEEFELNINLYNNSTFIYEVEDINEKLKYGQYYISGDRLFIKVIKKITDFEFAYLNENSILKYGKEALLKNSKKVNI